MSRWFRVYDDLIDDPKVQKLSGELVKFLLNVWCLASKNEGVLPLMCEIAFKLRVSENKAKKIIAELTDAGFIDEDETGKRPHNWNGRQFKSDVSTGRVKQCRKRKRNVSSDVTETELKLPQSTETETETERERKKDAGPSPANDLEFELFARGKQVLGKSAGGLIKNLLAAKDGNFALSRAAIETASTKQDPREFIGAIIRGRDALDDEAMARARGDRW